MVTTATAGHQNKHQVSREEQHAWLARFQKSEAEPTFRWLFDKQMRAAGASASTATAAPLLRTMRGTDVPLHGGQRSRNTGPSALTPL